MDLARHLLFENPATALAVLAIAAILLATVWRRTGARGCRLAALACLLAAAVLALAAWLVETDRERLARTLRTMAEAADAGRAEAFIERISPAYDDGTFGKAELADLVRRGLERVRAEAESPAIRMGRGEAVVTQAYRFRPAPGSGAAGLGAFERVVWEGRFAPAPDGEWRLRRAEAVHPRRMPPAEAGRYLRRRAR